MKIVSKPIKQLNPYENNPRINDSAVDAVAASIKEFGFKNPVIIDKNDVVVCGHTRLKAAEKLGLKAIPCIVADDLSDEKIKAFRLVDNKTAELAEWDFSLLEQELSDIDFDMSLFGFEESLFSDLSGEVEEDDFDIDSEIQNPTIAKLGDVFKLGNHRLICGDSTDEKTIEELMDGKRADMVFTDPPYNVAIGSKNAFLNTIQKSERITEDIKNDSGMTDEEIGKSLWLPAFKNMLQFAKDSCSLYVTMPQGGTHMMMMMMMISEAGWQVKHELMWLKNSPTFSMNRLDYDYKHEPILYGWKKSHKFYGGGSQNKSVWEFDKPRSCALHPTMKPIELIANAILNSSAKGDNVLDVFGGSGSTLIACEQVNRNCFMCELDPKYVDVIINRYIEQVGTSENVTLERDGQTYKYSELRIE